MLEVVCGEDLKDFTVIVLPQVTSQQAYMKLDPELYRDDMAVIKGEHEFR